MGIKRIKKPSDDITHIYLYPDFLINEFVFLFQVQRVQSLVWLHTYYATQYLQALNCKLVVLMYELCIFHFCRNNLSMFRRINSLLKLMEKEELFLN